MEMNGTLHRIRRRRSLLVLVAITWLPYVSVRCVEGATNGCPISATAHEHGEMKRETHSHEHHHATDAHDRGEADHEHGNLPGPERTCCQLTGKYAIELTSPTVSAPATTALAKIWTPSARPSAVSVLAVRHVPDPTHHPPPYLRFATLLI